ncbi:integral membrane domain protein [Lachnospiraceae bacterium CAG:364]|nr:integral membrane domain protein [Lachnospiraceae bacterium CAG:364]
MIKWTAKGERRRIMNIKKQYKGIFYIILSAFCFSLMDMFVRMSGDLPSIQKSFFRNIVAAVFGCILVLKEKDSFQWKKGSGKYLILRSLFGTLGILCNFYAIDHLALADASMLNKMSPFFVVIFSFLFLKEKVTAAQILLVMGAFGGSLFVVKPTVSNLDLIPSLIGLLGGLGAGAAYTMVRKLGTVGIKGPFIVFFFSTFSCVITLPWLIFDYHAMTLWQVLVLLLAGLCAAGGQFAITAAYCYAPASEVSIYDYTKVIFSMILGFVMFQQIPDFYSWVGYIIICLMAIFMFFYNKRRSAR